MPLPVVLGRLIDRRLSALRRHLRPALEGDVTGVHQARVATRRLREVLPLAGASGPKKDVATAVRVARRLTRALGPVRELDVALGLLDGVERDHGSLAAATEATRACVVEVREERRRALLEKVGREDASRLARRLRRVASQATPSDAWRGVLAQRARRRAEALGDAVDAAGTLYAAERLHAVRIAAKQLRYSLELVAETRAARCGRSVKTLKGMQDALGELHDFQILAHYAAAARLRAPAGGPAAAVLTDLMELIEDECRRLHAGYLGRRGRLLVAVKDTTARVVPALRAARRPKPRTARPATIG